jgi:hypothetical protein
MKPSPILLLSLAAALAAGAAQAQAASQPDLRLPSLGPSDFAQPSAAGASALAAPVARPVGVAASPTPDLADPLDPTARPKLVVNPFSSEVFATTAVGHQFDRNDKVTGSLGFLCGRQPSHADEGGGAAYGVDPHGRFVGAKLAFAF